MKRLQVVRESESDSAYALVVYENNQATAIAVTDDASAWAEWVNSSSMNMKQLNESLSHALYTGNARILTDEILTQAKSLYGDHLLAEITSNDSERTHEVVDAVVGHGRLYRSTAIRSKSMPAVSSARLSTISSSSRQAAIEYKALSYRSESTYSRLNFEMKKVRAVWDPDLGPSGGWRCPSGSQFGGYITDRFGRGCGGGIIRRVGRALVNAGRRIDNIGEQRQLRRLNRAAERAQKPGVGERAGDAIRRGVGQAAVALERGAQRLVGEYQPRDYVPNVGMRRQRRVGVPNVPEGRKQEIDDRLQAISRELDDLVDETPTPAVEKRIAELIRENRALRRERDGGPNGRAIVRPAGRGQGVNRPVPARPALPNRGQNRNVNRPERRQGARPVRKPVAERQRDGVMERAARGLVGGYNPDEYKPGDKKRIKNRENRYAKVKDEALLRALDVNRPRPLRPGEGRDVEARRRQERLEILQEMVNRRMEIPDAYKREVRVYKLKPQRKQRRDGLNRQGRAAVALERAAQRVLGGEERQPRNIPVDGIDAQTRRIANARKNRPANISDSDWQQYNEYLDSIPDGNLLIPGEAPQLEPVLSFNAWKKNVQPNQSVPRVRPNRPNAPQARKPVPKPVPKAPSVKKNLDGFSDDELLKILKKHKEKDPVPFEVADLSDEDLARLMDLLDTNQTIFLRNNQGLEPRDGYRLVFEEFNHRQDNGLWKTPKTPKAPVSVRARSRSARVQQAVSTPIRRPQPKRQRGKMLDAAQLDADQNFRLKRLVMDEKARLDADWRKRLGLGANEPVTSRAIKDYIKQRENNKPGAYIGVLKANANDWDVLNDLEQQINRRPPRAALNPDHIDLINKVGPKRRQKFIDGANASTVGRIRSNRPTRSRRTPVGQPAESPQRRSLNSANKRRIDGVARWGRQYDSSDDAKEVAKRYAKRDNKAYVVARDNETGKWQIVDAEALDEVLNDINDDSAAQKYIGEAFYVSPSASPASAKPESEYMSFNVSESARVSRNIEAVTESIGGSMPDDRSRRNVRNRFPNNGLPDKAFWRDSNWVGRDANDREKHEKRFARYYDADGNINARGRLINEQLRAEREGAPVPQVAPNKPAESEFQLNQLVAPVGVDMSLAERVADHPNYGINKGQGVREFLKLFKSDIDGFEQRGELDEINLIRDRNALLLDEHKNAFLKADNDADRAIHLNRWRQTFEQQVIVNNARTRMMAKNKPQSAQAPTAPSAPNVPSAKPNLVGPSAEFVPNEMRPARSPRIIGKKEYAERRKAIEHVHRNKGKLADVPDGVVIDVILADAKDAYGNPLTPDMLDKGLPDRWSSPRFEGKKVKPGQQSNEIWEVHRVKDKLTGEVWYLKTSEYGDDDALLEMVGANAAEMLEFGNRLDHIRVGEVRNRANKKGRWVMMRSVDEWDHGKALKGKNVKFQDAADVYLTPEQKKNINPRDAARMALMDFVLGNQDRHQGNFQVAIVGNDVRLAMIDMGLIGGGRAPDMGYRGKPHEFLLKEQMGKKIADYAYQFNNGLGGLRKLGYNHGGDQRKQEIFARQARRAAERLRSEIDTLFNKEVYERNGITLTPTEQKHLDAMRTVALDRLNYILNKRGLDDLVRYFG